MGISGETTPKGKTTMATKSNKKASKKATSKKAAKPAPEATESRAEKRAALIAQVMDLVDVKGQTFDEAAETLGVNRSTVIGAHTFGSVKPKDRIKGTDEEKAEQIATLRDDENIAWYVIAARADISQSKAKALYEEHTGNSANQGHAVVQRRAAERAESEPKVKAKTASTKKASSKAKAEKVTKARKKAKGTANPSKG